MSTFNGEKFIKEQIDSILRQESVQVILYIRDDGSTDYTVKIIEDYIFQGYNIFLIKGENVGFEKSFALISHQRVDADFYAFSDQDDVWKTKKLIHAITILQGCTSPGLYGGNIIVTKEGVTDGYPLYEKNFFDIRDHILKCFALGYTPYGCSMVWNKELQKMIYKHFPKYLVSHDVYLCILAGVLGKIYIDREPMIYHRLHGKNTAGIETKIWKRLSKAYRLYWGKKRRRLSAVVNEIMINYQTEIEEAQNSRELFFKVANYEKSIRDKFRLMLDKELRSLRFDRVIWNEMLVWFHKL